MFLETEENAELLELLSQVRAAAALEESEETLPFSGASSDALHPSLQHGRVRGAPAALGTHTAILHREDLSTATPAEGTYTPCELQRPSGPPFGEPSGTIRDSERGSWSSPGPNPSSRCRSKQPHSGLMSDAYGLSPTSTLPTPAMGCGAAPAAGVVAATGHHAHPDSAGRLLSSEHGDALQRTGALDSLHPMDEHAVSQRKLSFTGGAACAASPFAYTTSSTRVTVSPTDARPCDALQQPPRPAEMRYTLCQAKVVDTPDLPSSAVARLALLPGAMGGKSISAAATISEAVTTQQLIGACATPPTTSAVLALGPAYGGLLPASDRVQTTSIGTALPFSSDCGSPQSVTPLHRKALPRATSSGERHVQVSIQHSSGEGMVVSHGSMPTAHAVDVEVGTGTGRGTGQNTDQTAVIPTKSNNAHHAIPMNLSLPATPVQGGGWGNDSCAAADIWQQVPQTLNDEDCGTPQHHLFRPRSNELNIFMLPSPPRPLAALPLTSCTTETVQQMQNIPFASDSSGRSPVDPTHIHHYLSSLHVANMRGGTEAFSRPPQPNQEGSHSNIRTGYSNPSMTQVPPVITMHAVRPKTSTSTDSPSRASRPISQPSNVSNARTSVVIGSTAVPNSTSVFLSSIAHLQDGHTPCGGKSSGMDWQRGFTSLVGPSQATKSEDNGANTPGSGGPPPSERYAHYLQRGVLTSPFMPIQQPNAHPQLQRRPNSTTAITLNATATPKTAKNSNPRNSSTKGACSSTNTSLHVVSATAAVGTGRASGGTRQSNSHHSHCVAAGSPNAPGCVSPSIAATLLLFLNTPECGDSSGDNTFAEDDAAGGVLGRQILALSRDQQGCRSLQAVLDCEAANRYGDAMMPSARVRGSQDYGGAKHLQKDDNERRGGDTVVGAVNTVASGDASSLPPLSLPLRRIIAALEPHLPQVMSDAYGNFLVQKLFEVLNDDERLPLLCKGSILHKGLGEVACSPHGTFAVQRLVETLRNEAEEEAVFSSLGDHLVQLLLDANGGHVLLKVMSYIKGAYGSRGAGVGSVTVSPTAVNPHTTLGEGNVESNLKYRGSTNAVSEENSCLRKALQSGELSVDAMRQKIRFLYDGLLKSILVVCRHRQGCCITQKCLDFFAQIFPVTSDARDAPLTTSQPSGHEDFFVGLVKKLLEHLTALVMDPYGNYVITHAVEVCYARGSIQLVDVVAQRMQERMTSFCKDKYASNVMEHVLRYSSEKRIRAFCRNLLTPSTLAFSASRDRSLGRGNSDKKTPKTRDARGCESEGSAVPGDPAALLDWHLWPLVDVALDPFGNYVVQTLLTVAPVDELFHVEDTTQTGLSESFEQHDEKSHTHDENPYRLSKQGSHSSTLVNKTRDNSYGLLPVLQRYLPLLQEKSFTRKIETKMELALLRVEEEKMRRQHQK
ncbi:unnamed protein product [Phytomonas sp. EM1]|nr:unnamed protein product [Phytomonas sp. EM1]|eukprot:CCW64162.1 unnamed protein product [Phytomonas sp. isolate EM1]